MSSPVDQDRAPFAAASGARPHVTLSGLGKKFGGVAALDDVSLEIAQGSIHALVGENGAGKSTLGRIIAGMVSPDSGTMLMEGRTVSYESPRQALADGVTMIAQEMMLVPQRSAIDNVFLGSEANQKGWLKPAAMRSRYEELCEQAGFDVDAKAKVGTLRVADQQKVEILRALARDARLIVMDEPTAALTAEESEGLFSTIRGLRAAGRTIVFVSHFLEDVLGLSDFITVLRDGRLIQTGEAKGQTPAALVEAMLGRSLDVTFPEKAPSPRSKVVLSVRGLSRKGSLDEVSFDVHEGEVLGIAGLVGAGRTEALRAIFGADRPEAGTVELDGEPVAIRSPRDAVRAGIAMLPESRKDQGLLMGFSVTRNVSLPHLGEVSQGGWMRGAEERRRVAEIAQRVDLPSGREEAQVGTLSGGNQQKALFAKWLFRQPRVLLADEPTRGVDVGAKRTIYELINGLAAEGMSIVLVSSELEEVLGLAHRIVVMRNGRVVGMYSGDQVSEDDLLHASFGTQGVDR